MDNWWKSALIFLLITYLTSKGLFVHSRHTKRVHYGAPCNSTVKCDIHSLLTCEDNTCVCLYQDAMSYSSELGTCLSLVNEVCGYLETKRVFINCISNAVCDQQQGVCKCTQGFIELERMCVQQKGHGEPCHSNSECKTDLSLTCFEEVCQCDPDKYVAMPVELNGEEVLTQSRSKKPELKCVTRAGLPCTAKAGCVPKANCVAGGSEDGTEALSRVYNWNHSGVCKCDSGYEMDKNGLCKGKFGSSCDVLKNITCMDKFRCLNGKCDCTYPNDQVYQEDTDQCVSLLGGPCSDPDDESDDDKPSNKNNSTLTCARFLICKDEVCGCKSGFVENSDRGCDLAYGQPCTGETMSKCDKVAGLHCVEGKCSCMDDRKLYDSSIGKCLGKKGASCKLTIPASEESGSSIETTKAYRKANRGRQKGKLNSDCVYGTECLLPREQLRGLTTRGTCTSPRNKENGSSNESSD